MKTTASAGVLLTLTSLLTTSVTQDGAMGLKVHLEYMDDGFTLRTKNVVKEALRHLSGLLSIRDGRRNSVFRVPRDEEACAFDYFDGPNAGKCGQISKVYNEQLCGGVGLPPAHLEGLQVFGREGAEPLSTSLPEGRGFTDGTNFVVYLTSRTSRLCGSSLAHSQVCGMEAARTGSGQGGRPVAGMINVCWKEGEVQDVMVKRVVVHELLHLLGMNYKSIRAFVECEGKGNARMCWKLEDVVRVTLDGKVVVWSRHFRKVIRHWKACEDSVRQCVRSSDCLDCPPQACSAYDGMILDNVTRAVSTSGGIALATTRTGVHWPKDLFDDPASIMNPKYADSGRVMLDPLTLALFRTSGWYCINYTVLPCINQFLNSETPSFECDNSLETKNSSTSQNETREGGKVHAQNSPPVIFSKGHRPAIASEGMAGNETQTEGPNGGRVSVDVKSYATQCSPVCAVILAIQAVFLYRALQGGGWARQDGEPSLPPPPQP